MTDSRWVVSGDVLEDHKVEAVSEWVRELKLERVRVLGWSIRANEDGTMGLIVNGKGVDVDGVRRSLTFTVLL